MGSLLWSKDVMRHTATAAVIIITYMTYITFITSQIRHDHPQSP
jgi:hypothetical protein